MSQLAQTVIAMNAAFNAHGINHSLLHELLTDAVESAEAVLQGGGQVIPTSKKLRLRAKINTGLIVMSLIEHHDFLERLKD
jgi:FAD/FMN-containing dehydrogenase